LLGQKLQIPIVSLFVLAVAVTMTPTSNYIYLVSMIYHSHMEENLTHRIARFKTETKASKL
jgi:hypothetical protein